MVRKTLIAAVVGGFSLALAPAALAGPIDPLLVSGTNFFQDRSGENAYRCSDEATSLDNCRRLTDNDSVQNTPGSEEEGTFDLLAGFLNFEDINGVNAAPNELSSIFATRLTGTQNTDFGTIITTAPVGANLFEALFDIELDDFAPEASLLAGAQDDFLGLLFQDNNTDLDTAIRSTSAGPDPFQDGRDAVVDGQFAAALGIVTDDDFFTAGIQQPFGTLGSLPSGDLLSLRFGLSFQSYALSGEFVPGGRTITRRTDGGQSVVDLTGSGSVTRPDEQNISGNFHFGNDVQSQFVRIPIPGTLGLFGIGLIGLGALARRVQRT